MAAGFSSSTAAVGMTVEGAPARDLATLMPDGAVGASASGGRSVVMAQDDYSMLRLDADTRPSEHGAALAEKRVTGAGSWRRLLDTPVAA